MIFTKTNILLGEQSSKHQSAYNNNTEHSLCSNKETLIMVSLPLANHLPIKSSTNEDWNITKTSLG